MGTREARTLLALSYMQSERDSIFSETGEDQIMARECNRWHSQLSTQPRAGQNVSFGFTRVSRFFAAWKQASGRGRMTADGLVVRPRQEANATDSKGSEARPQRSTKAPDA